MPLSRSWLRKKTLCAWRFCPERSLGSHGIKGVGVIELVRCLRCGVERRFTTAPDGKKTVEDLPGGALTSAVRGGRIV